MESSLVSGVGAIATSSSAASGPGSASTRAVTSASRPSRSTTTSPGSTLGAGCSTVPRSSPVGGADVSDPPPHSGAVEFVREDYDGDGREGDVAARRAPRAPNGREGREGDVLEGWFVLNDAVVARDLRL